LLCRAFGFLLSPALNAQSYIYLSILQVLAQKNGLGLRQMARGASGVRRGNSMKS